MVGRIKSYNYRDFIEKLNIQGIQSEIDVEKIKLLKRALDETGAKVVLSSSWRYTRKAQNLKELLANFEIYTESTPYIHGKRGLEIKQWLLDNPEVEDFVILDDEIFESYDEELLKKLIKISNGNGYNFGEELLPKDIDKIIEKLGKKKEKEEESER